MVLENLSILQTYMNMGKSKTEQTNPPMFKITASLSAPEVVIHPTIDEINKYLNMTLSGVVESPKHFVRYINDVCCK